MNIFPPSCKGSWKWAALLKIWLFCQSREKENWYQRTPVCFFLQIPFFLVQLTDWKVFSCFISVNVQSFILDWFCLQFTLRQLRTREAEKKITLYAGGDVKKRAHQYHPRAFLESNLITPNTHWYTYPQIHWVLYIKYVQVFICQSYLNKGLFSKKVVFNIKPLKREREVKWFAPGHKISRLFGEWGLNGN